MEQKQVIISIGREFASAGHEIAEILATRFGLPLYDYNLLREVAADKKIKVENIEPYDELPGIGFVYRTVKGHNNSPHVNIAHMQFDFLKKKADEGESFVVVGRCAEEVLKENKALITIFILGDMDKKIQRVMKYHQLSQRKAINFIKSQDKKRKAYHNYFCQHKWGDSRNYEICINSSKLGIDATVDLLENYIRQRIKEM